MYISVLVLISVVATRAQNYRDYVKAAESSFGDGDYYRAALLYKEALKKTTTEEAIYGYAESLRLSDDYDQAAIEYEKLVRDSLFRFPLAQYWLAEMQKRQGRYQRAQKNFRKFADYGYDVDSFYQVKAIHEVVSCEKAIELKFNPVGVEVSHMDTSVNTVYSEFGLSGFGPEKLLFSSMRPVDSLDAYKIRIYQRDTGKVAVAKQLDSLINSLDYDIANPFFDNKANRIYYTRLTEKGFSEILYSELDEGGWTSPVLLSETINKDSCNNTQPSIARFDGTTYLLFASDRKGDGGFDIWYSEISEGVQFLEPAPIGFNLAGIDKDLLYLYNISSKVNTMGNEITPYYSIQDTALYFASDWHYGLGGFDIFKCKGDFTTWKEPENLGYPINSSYNDLYFRYDDKKQFAYLTSNRKGSLIMRNEGCCNDVFYFSLPDFVDEEKEEEIKIELFTKEIKLLVPLTLYFHNDEPNPRTTDTVTNVNYENSVLSYMAMLDEYRENYSSGAKKKDKDFAVEEIEKFFRDDVDQGYRKLQEFAKLSEELLGKGQNITITLKGYASPLHNTEYNGKLAKRRISSLVNYFREFNGGVFIQYEENGQLVYEEVAFGETMANSAVSDDIKDVRNSVYSPVAGRERKIEIIAVAITNEN